MEVEDEDALTFCPILVDPVLFAMLGMDTSTDTGIETGVDPEAWTGSEARTARGVISSRVCAWACICPVPWFMLRVLMVSVSVRFRGVASIAPGAPGGAPRARSSLTFGSRATIPSETPSSALFVLIIICASTSSASETSTPAVGIGESATMPTALRGGGTFSSVS